MDKKRIKINSDMILWFILYSSIYYRVIFLILLYKIWLYNLNILYKYYYVHLVNIEKNI